jgi:hypothetical protein
MKEFVMQFLLAAQTANVDRTVNAQLKRNALLNVHAIIHLNLLVATVAQIANVERIVNAQLKRNVLLNVHAIMFKLLFENFIHFILNFHVFKNILQVNFEIVFQVNEKNEKKLHLFEEPKNLNFLSDLKENNSIISTIFSFDNKFREISMIIKEISK